MRFLIGLIVLVGIIISLAKLSRYYKGKHEAFECKEDIRITSQSFGNDSMMGVEYTGNGEDKSPQLALEDISEKGESIAIIMDDLDHPLGPYNHWLIWNIPVKYSSIPEGISKGASVKDLDNAIQGKSEYGGKNFYRGPKPPFGVHRYRFTVFVLDSFLDYNATLRKRDIVKAMEGHVVQSGSITGIYGKK